LSSDCSGEYSVTACPGAVSVQKFSSLALRTETTLEQ
jgi:hypothetical protein